MFGFKGVQERRDRDFMHRVDERIRNDCSSREARAQGYRGARRMECGCLRPIRHHAYRKPLNRLTYLHQSHF